MHKNDHNQLPKVFQSYFIKISDQHNYNTKLSATNYNLKKTNFKFVQNGIKVVGLKIWFKVTDQVKKVSAGKCKK